MNRLILKLYRLIICCSGTQVAGHLIYSRITRKVPENRPFNTVTYLISGRKGQHSNQTEFLLDPEDLFVFLELRPRSFAIVCEGAPDIAHLFADAA